MKKAFYLLLIILCSSIHIFAQPYSKKNSTQDEWEQYFKDTTRVLDPIEGIWSNSNTKKIYNRHYNNLTNTYYFPHYSTIAIYKDGNIYMSYVIGIGDDKPNFSFKNTASAGNYSAEITYQETNSKEKVKAVLTRIDSLAFSFEKPTAQLKFEYKNKFDDKSIANTLIIYEHQWTKIFPGRQVTDKK